MPGAITRRGRPSKKNAFSKQAGATISSCARVSKPKGQQEKELIEKASRAEDASTVTVCSPSAPAATPRKRKAAVAAEVDTASKKRTQKPRRKTRLQTASSADVDSAATTEAEALLGRLQLQSSSPSTSRSYSPFNVDTPITSASESETERWGEQAVRLPRELLDLVNLHSAFLKTLSLHYAHNGSHSPADIRTLGPSISQAWGKRRVTLDDIRRCVGFHCDEDEDRMQEDTSGGISDAPRSPFFLVDYGRGKVCVELHQHAVGGRPLNEHALNTHFGRSLRRAWARRDSGDDAKSFILRLPKATTKECVAAINRTAHPLLAKGQRTLEELKSGIAMRKQLEKEKAQEKAARMNPVVAETAGASGGPMSLLDRIRSRQLQHAQTQSTAPTPADLARRAALQRAGDVAAVLSMLIASTARGQARISFTMTAVLVKLKDSLRVPISREESAGCVRVLAAEVAPQWLRVVTVGGRENLVVQTAFAPTRAAIQERVRFLLA